MVIKTVITSIIKDLYMLKEMLLRMPSLSFPKPEIVIGEENKPDFLDKLASSKSSVICIVTKEETLNLINNIPNKQNRQFIRYAPSDVENSYYFNWMPLCKDNPTNSSLVAQTIMNAHYRFILNRVVKDFSVKEFKRAFANNCNYGSRQQEFCVDYASCFLAALFGYVAEMQNATPAKVYDYLANMLASDGQKRLLDILTNCDKENVRELVKFFNRLDERIRLDLISIVANALSFLTNEKLRAFTSNSTQPPDFQTLREENFFVYLDLTKEKPQELAPLSSLFFHIATSQLNRKQGNSVYLFVDDLNKSEYIHNLRSVILSTKIHDLGLVFYASSLEELEQIYWKPDWEVNCFWETEEILNNCVVDEEQLPLLKAFFSQSSIKNKVS